MDMSPGGRRHVRNSIGFLSDILLIDQFSFSFIATTRGRPLTLLPSLLVLVNLSLRLRYFRLQSKPTIIKYYTYICMRWEDGRREKMTKPKTTNGNLSVYRSVFGMANDGRNQEVPPHPHPHTSITSYSDTIYANGDQCVELMGTQTEATASPSPPTASAI